MTFELVRGSGSRVASTVFIDKHNANADLWWCGRKQEWHWFLIWEDGGPYGTHIHSGSAATKEGARADIVKTIVWVEDKWPTLEYFEIA